ncbi:MAG: regulator [Thermoplasmataceae archaeon]
MKVIRYFITYGLAINEKFPEEPSVYCANIEVRPNAIALAIGVDRRVVQGVVNKIFKDKELLRFFKEMRPIADMGLVSSKILHLGIIEIIPEDPAKSGIISGIINIISDFNIGIRQVMVDDPIISDSPRARIVTDSPLPGEALPLMRKVPGVKGIIIL